MAANTPVSLQLQARDFEHIIGIMDNSAIPAFRRLKVDLANYYAANGNPQNTTLVTVNTKEFLLIEIFRAMFGTSAVNVHNDTGASPFNRIITAIRAANNPADNYIQTQLATEDASRNATITAVRKNGRAVLMMDTYDNN